MPRAIWKGHVSFGLVNIPVALYPAEKRSELSFHMLDKRNKARIRFKRVNEETGEEVPWNDIVKAYDYGDGKYVEITDEDLKAAAPEKTQTAEILGFVDADQIDYVYYDKPYYLAPAKRGEKGYVLLRETLKRSGKVGIAKVVITSREHLAALVPEGEDAMALVLLRYAEEVRGLDDLEVPAGGLKAQKVSDKEVQMAEKLVEAMSTDFDPAQYRDEYRDKLMEYIEQGRVGRDGQAAQAQGNRRGRRRHQHHGAAQEERGRFRPQADQTGQAAQDARQEKDRIVGTELREAWIGGQPSARGEPTG